jgi:hypothetical protein
VPGATAVNTAGVGASASSDAPVKVELLFDGISAPMHASVVVGADGIFSAVQHQKLGDPLEYLGVIVILGIVRLPTLLRWQVHTVYLSILVGGECTRAR